MMLDTCYFLRLKLTPTGNHLTSALALQDRSIAKKAGLAVVLREWLRIESGTGPLTFPKRSVAALVVFLISFALVRLGVSTIIEGATGKATLQIS
jgi:hypothetical protein